MAARILEAYEAGERETVKRLATQLAAQVEKLGLVSSFPYWALAVAHDDLGEWEPAFLFIQKALERDCCSIHIQHSYDIIVNHMRARLAETPRQSVVVARLYMRMVGAGEADTACQVALLEHFLAVNRNDTAASMAATLTQTAPHLPDGWKALAVVAERRGDLEEAARCERQAALVAASTAQAAELDAQDEDDEDE